MVSHLVSLFWTQLHSIDCNNYNIHFGQQFEDQKGRRKQIIWAFILIRWSYDRTDFCPFNISNYSYFRYFLFWWHLREKESIFSCFLQWFLYHTFGYIYLCCDFDRYFIHRKFIKFMFPWVKNMVGDRLLCFCLFCPQVHISHENIELKSKCNDHPLKWYSNLKYWCKKRLVIKER